MLVGPLGTQAMEQTVGGAKPPGLLAGLTPPPCAATSSITGLLVGRAALCRMFVIATAGAQRYF